MDITEIVDSPVVRDFRCLFYEVTGMATALSFPGLKTAGTSFLPKKARSGFCQIVHSSPEGLTMCRRFDAQLGEMVKKSPEAVVCPCYAGLTGVAVPVFFDDECQGAILAGDVFTRKPTRADFERTMQSLSGLNLPVGQLEKAFFSIPVVSRRTLKMAVRMLSLIVNYIVDREHNIGLQEAMYQKQSEIADAMAARTALVNDLSEKMGEVEALRKQLRFKTYLDENTVAFARIGNRSKRMMTQAISFIEKHYAEEITLQDVADHIGISRNYLSSFFHKEYGGTFIDYLIEKRISKACDLLRDLSLNVSEVSMEVGYFNISHFTRLFKRHTGMTPGRYRDCVHVEQVDIASAG